MTRLVYDPSGARAFGSDATTYVAQLSPTSGANLEHVILPIIGTLLLIVLAGRGLSAFANERYGAMLTAILAAVPVVGMCYFPDQMLSVLKSLFTTFFGGG